MHVFDWMVEFAAVGDWTPNVNKDLEERSRLLHRVSRREDRTRFSSSRICRV